MAEESEATNVPGRVILSNPPIIEAILEIHWPVFNPGDIPPLNEKFKLLPGRLHERVKASFPFIEVLPNSAIPDEMDPNIPRFRYRTEEGKYPLIQVGPGVLTVNLDKNNFMAQNNFYDTILDVLAKFFSVLNVQLSHIHLHYIDAFQYQGSSLFDFIGEKLKTHFSFQPELFQVMGISSEPEDFMVESSYRVEDPPGKFRCRLRKGQVAGNDKMLIMDTMCLSQGPEIPARENIGEWFIKADDLIHKWFYEMIKNYPELW